MCVIDRVIVRVFFFTLTHTEITQSAHNLALRLSEVPVTSHQVSLMFVDDDLCVVCLTSHLKVHI